MAKIAQTDETMAAMVQRIIEAWQLASADDIAEGRAWYPMARELAHIVGQGNATLGAAVISALSPMLGWDENARLALRHARGEFGGCLGSAKAVQIIDGLDPIAAFAPATSQKTRNFWHNIMAADRTRVTIDRHAFAIAMHEAGQPTAAQYEFFAEAYRQAAAQLGEECPAVVQAVTWVWWRREGQAKFLA